MDTEHHGQLVTEDGVDGNDDVTVMGDISDGYGLRSTSVGDQVLVGTEKYVVAPFGFQTLDGEPV